MSLARATVGVGLYSAIVAFRGDTQLFLLWLLLYFTTSLDAICFQRNKKK